MSSGELASRVAALSGKSWLVLTHFGRKTGKPYNTTLWFVADGPAIYLETADVQRQWVRNTIKRPDVELTIDGQRFAGRVTQITDTAEQARAQKLRNGKYLIVRILGWTGLLRLILRRPGFFRVDLQD